MTIILSILFVSRNTCNCITLPQNWRFLCLSSTFLFHFTLLFVFRYTLWPFVIEQTLMVCQLLDKVFVKFFFALSVGFRHKIYETPYRKYIFWIEWVINQVCTTILSLVIEFWLIKPFSVNYSEIQPKRPWKKKWHTVMANLVYIKVHTGVPSAPMLCE